MTQQNNVPYFQWITQEMLEGIICPYCNQPSVYCDSRVIYGKSYGMIYLCKPCNAYVGFHKNSRLALGRLANKELREAKKEAHHYFDMIWKQGHMNRSEAYKWLSEQLNIDSRHTHIGMFDVKLCTDTVEASKMFLNDMRRLDIDLGVPPQTPYFG